MRYPCTAIDTQPLGDVGHTTPLDVKSSISLEEGNATTLGYAVTLGYIATLRYGTNLRYVTTLGYTTTFGGSQPRQTLNPKCYRLAIHARPFGPYPVLVLGAVSSLLEPFRGHLSPKVIKILQH